MPTGPLYFPPPAVPCLPLTWSFAGSVFVPPFRNRRCGYSVSARKGGLVHDMAILIVIVVSLLVLGAAVMAFLRADPGRLAAWLQRSGARPRAHRRSVVRTAALEMELDHDTGALEGLVLAGRREGRRLGSMKRAELLLLYRELRGDPEARQLLEAYLDSRFPVWRRDAEPDDGEGLRVAPRAGAMTKEEAYKILGLEAGAAAADVRKAHRRLMQRLRPDVGHASFLAARIDEAKDVLLSTHD